VGIAHHWDRALGEREEVRARIRDAIAAIRDGTFARHLVDEQRRDYPELASWQRQRPQSRVAAERSLRQLIRKPHRTSPRNG